MILILITLDCANNHVGYRVHFTFTKGLSQIKIPVYLNTCLFVVRYLSKELKLTMNLDDVVAYVIHPLFSNERI